MGGLEKNSARVVAVAFALIMVFIGTTLFGDPITMTKAIIMFAAAVILLFEIGIKNVLDLGRYRNFTNVISISLILVLFIAAIFTFANISLWQWVANVLDYVLVLAAGWIAVEAFV